jgi:hypothetical protein
MHFLKKPPPRHDRDNLQIVGFDRARAIEFPHLESQRPPHITATKGDVSSFDDLTIRMHVSPPLMSFLSALSYRDYEVHHNPAVFGHRGTFKAEYRYGCPTHNRTLESLLFGIDLSSGSTMRRLGSRSTR